jgi:hypothetical protein
VHHPCCTLPTHVPNLLALFDFANRHEQQLFSLHRATATAAAAAAAAFVKHQVLLKSWQSVLGALLDVVCPCRDHLLLVR